MWLSHPPLKLTIVLLVVAYPVASWAQTPSIQWNPNQVNYTIGNGHGASAPVSVTFTSSIPIPAVSVFLTPSLAQFVAVEPTGITAVQPNTQYSFTLEFFLPPNAQPGTYEGTLHIRSGSQTIPNTLQITVVVDFGTNLVSPNARTLSQVAQNLLTSATVQGGTTTLVFSQWSDEFVDLVPGRVLGLVPNPVAPFGFIGKITDISLSAGQVYVTTVPASLTDALISADITFSTHLTSAQPSSPTSTPQSTTSAASTIGLGTIVLSAPIITSPICSDISLATDFGTLNNQVTLSGCLSLTSDVGACQRP